MSKLKLNGVIAGILATIGVVVAPPSMAQMKHMPGVAMPGHASAGKVIVSDPASAMMIIDRDSNDIAFMDLKSRKCSDGRFSATTSIRTRR